MYSSPSPNAESSLEVVITTTNGHPWTPIKTLACQKRPLAAFVSLRVHSWFQCLFAKPTHSLTSSLLILFLLTSTIHAQEQPATEPARKPLVSPFQEDEELMALERAREEARLKAELEAKLAAETKEETRRVAIQAALAPIKVLARGLQGNRAVVLLALDSNRRIMLAKDESMTLNTTVGAVEIRLRSVTRQTLSFELSDGTILPLQ